MADPVIIAKRTTTGGGGALALDNLSAPNDLIPANPATVQLSDWNTTAQIQNDSQLIGYIDAGLVILNVDGVDLDQTESGNFATTTASPTSPTFPTTTDTGGASSNAGFLIELDGSGRLDGRDVGADGTAQDNHIANVANPHATDLGNLGGGTLAELQTVVTDATIVDTASTQTLTNKTLTTPTISGDATMSGGGTITNLAAPVNDNDAARLVDVNRAAAGINSKESCRVATTDILDNNTSISGSPTYTYNGGTSTRGQITATLSVSDQFTVDGVTLGSADDGARVLIKNEDTGVAQVHSVDTIAENAAPVDGSLNNDYFIFYTTPEFGFYVWFNVASGGADPTPTPPAGVTYTAIPVAIAAAATAATVATAIKTNIDATDFTGKGNQPDVSIGGAGSNEITITNAFGGAVTNVADGGGNGTGFTFATDTSGTGLGGAANGIYTTTVSGTSLTLDRATDFDEDAEVTANAFTFTSEGTANVDSQWILTTNDPITVGGDAGTPQQWAQFGATVSDHTGLTNLAWTSSGHTGTASRVAGFDGGGAASYLQIGVDIQAWDTDLDALGGLTTTGVIVRTGTGTATTRTITGTASRITVTNGDGVSGNPTIDVGANVILTTTSLGGDLSGTLPNPTVTDLTITGESQGSILYFDGSNWVQLAPGTSGQVLQTNGVAANPSWVTPADVSGPGSSTDNALVRWDGTTGTLIQDSTGWTLGDTGILDGSGGGLVLPQGTTPTPTTEGQIAWDTDGDFLVVGDGTGTKTIVDTDGTQTLSNKTLVTPTIASFVNAQHDHQDAAGGGQLDHGLALTGLGDDDHSQYVLLTGNAARNALTGTLDASGGTILLPQGTTPAPTAEGQIAWDTDDDVLRVGTGAGTINVIASNTSAGGDLGGTYPNPSVTDLTITGEVQGSVLYYNGSNWVQLAPGTSGQVLQTNGAAANPSWVTPSTGTTDHTALSNLDWTSSGHTDTAGSLAAFTTAGAASLLTGVAQGDVIYFDGTDWTRLAPGTSGQFLQTTGAGSNPQWATPTGSGDVSGPGSSTDNALVRWDGTTGTLIQDSTGWTLGDTGILDGSGGGLILPQGTTPTPTTEGQIAWDTDGDFLVVGDGTGTKTIVDTDGTQTLSNKTLVTPTIASFVNAQHDHQDAAGGGQLDHGLALTGLGDDDHTQYTLADGTRAFTGTVGGITPTDPAHLTTKSYVDGLVTGISWKEPVDVRDYLGTRTVTEINALTPSIGQSVVAGSAGTPTAGTSDTVAIGDLVEFDGTSWKVIVTNSGGFPPDGTRALVATETVTLYAPLTDNTDEGKFATWDGTSLTPALTSPVDGDAVLVRGETSVNENKQYVYDGTVPSGLWVQFGGAGQAHSALSDLLWTSSGHTGTASRIAAFDGSGVASYLQVGVDVQAWDADLDALAALAGTGIAVRTGANTWAQRTITGTAGLITVTNGDGVSGNPTINVGANVITTSDSASGDVSGSYPGPLTVTDLTITSEAQGDILYFNGTNWVRLAAGSSGQVLQTNGTGADPTWVDNAGTATLGATWRFSSTTTAADPGSKTFRLDNATQGSATNIYISDIADSNVDMSTVLANLTTDDRLYIQDERDATRFHLVRVTGTPTDNTGWFTIPIAVEDSGVDLVNNNRCGFIMFFERAGGGSSDHSALSNLAWTSSGHTGTAGSLAAFTTAGAASEVTGTVHGDVLYFDGTDWTRLAPGTSGQYLRTNGTGAAPSWQTLAGGGDVSGPGSSTDNALVRWDGTTGTVIQDSTGWLLGDTGTLDGSAGGLILPQGTTPTPTAEGQIAWDTDDNHLRVGDGATTVTIIDDVTPAGGDLGGTYPNPTVTDLTIAGGQQGDILYFNGTNWVRLAAGTAGQILVTNGAGANPSWGNAGDSASRVDNITLTSSSGSPFIETTSATYDTLAHIGFLGTTDSTPSTIYVLGGQSSPGTYSARIWDVTNSLVIAEATGLTNAAIDLVNLGAISNLSTGTAIWQLQVLKTGGGNKAQIGGLMVVY